jgi:preprotein translocase subunit SecD
MLQIDTWKRVLILLTCVAGLLLALPNGFYTRVEAYNDAAAALELRGEGAEPTAIEEASLGLWPSFLPSSIVNLGLDLRGGAHLLAEVQLEQVYETQMDSLWPEVRDAVRSITPLRRDPAAPGDMIRARVTDPSRMDEVRSALLDLARPVQSLTGLGATNILVRIQGDSFEVTLSEDEKRAVDERTMQQSLEIVRRRIDEAGTREPTIQRQGVNRILIQVPGIGSAAELKDLIGTTAALTFNPVVRVISDGNANPGIGNALLPSMEDPDRFYVIEKASVVTGEDLVDAQPSFDRNGGPAVNFRFNTSGARRFGDYTAENEGALFAIVLDGEVVSAPRIKEHIPGGSGIISGNFTIEESTILAVLLRAGALPAELSFLEERTIGPELGQDSIDAGKIATMVAFAAVLVFMFLSYGRFGLFANIALIINIALIFGLLSLIGVTLTLPGIAGIVLTVGMAVDANVLIFERIREELKTSKGPARAIELGYEKALSAIVDANITTLITAVILLVMGSGPVQGFAWTLMIGIITSVFTAIFVTRLLVVMWFERARPKVIEV